MEKLDFSCSKCFKTFYVESGQGLIKVRCPYCSGINEVNTGKVVSNEPDDSIPTTPIEKAWITKSNKFDDIVKHLKQTKISVGDDVILSFWSNAGYDNDLIPVEEYAGKITKWKISGTSLFRGANFEIQVTLLNGKTITISSADTDRSYPKKHFVFVPPHAEPERIVIEKYHPVIYRQRCSKVIEINNKSGNTYPR